MDLCPAWWPPLAAFPWPGRHIRDLQTQNENKVTPKGYKKTVKQINYELSSGCFLKPHD